MTDVATLAPASGVDQDPRLAPFRDSRLAWWLLRSERIAAWCAELVSRAPSTAAEPRSWVARIEGSQEDVRYALATVSHELRAGDTNETGHIVAGLDDSGALSLLDSLAVARLGLLLARTVNTELEALTDLVSGGESGDVAPPLDLVILVPLGAGHAVLGWPFGRPIAPLPGLRLSTIAEPLPSARRGAASQPRRMQVGRTTAALFALVLVAAGGAATAAWQHAHRSGSPPQARPATSMRPASGPSPSPFPAVPAPSTGGGLAIDEAHGDVVLFGGVNDDGGTWTWSGQRWHRQAPAASPQGRSGAAMAYDPVTRRVLLYGGRLAQGTVVNDTWQWDGATWSRLDAGGQAAPPAGEFGSMAWDDARSEMLLVKNSASTAPETWTWDGARWTAHRTSMGPPAAPASVLAYDPARRCVLLVTVGGAQDDPYSPSETWSWDGVAWQRLAPAHAPHAGFPSGLALDPLSGRLVLVGPSREQLSPGVKTWSWDGRDWVQLGSTGGGPATLGAVTMAADGLMEAVGWAQPGSSGPLGVWGWTGTAWMRLADGGGTPTPPGPLPTPRHFAATAYDPVHHRLVIFGGQALETTAASPNAYLSDTWTFDGGRWTRMPATAELPPSVGPTTFDPTTHTVLLVADANGPYGQGPVRPMTWSWDGSAWRPLHPAAEMPRGVWPLAMVGDPAHSDVVAVATCCKSTDGSGGSLGRPTTWIWDGRGWSQRNPATELGSGLQVALAYDARLRRVIAVGGSGDVTPISTWAWDGTTWTELHPVRPVVFDPLTATMAYDTSTGMVVLLERSVQTTDTFERAGGTQLFDGSTWKDLIDTQAGDADTAYASAALYVDPTIGRLVVVSSATDDFAEEWLWSGARWLQVALNSSS